MPGDLFDPAVSVSFDYDQVPAADRGFVREAAAEIRTRQERVSTEVVEMGLKLAEVKRRLPHGQFQAWLRAEFRDWSDRTARALMAVARNFKTEPGSVLAQFE